MTKEEYDNIRIKDFPLILTVNIDFPEKDVKAGDKVYIRHFNDMQYYGWLYLDFVKSQK
jgi:hypothetical protein